MVEPGATVRGAGVLEGLHAPTTSIIFLVVASSCMLMLVSVCCECSGCRGVQMMHCSCYQRSLFKTGVVTRARGDIWRNPREGAWHLKRPGGQLDHRI